MRQKRHLFSLIELLVVIVIIGAIAGMILPRLSDVTTDSRIQIARGEMSQIQHTFARFAMETNVGLNLYKLEDMVSYGLWPLMEGNHPDTRIAYPENYVYEAYDLRSSEGRRTMQYLPISKHVNIARPTLSAQTKTAFYHTAFDDVLYGGQATVPQSETAVSIPVISDPFGGYYRVVCIWRNFFDANSKYIAPDDPPFYTLKGLGLVCTGPNKVLEINADCFDQDGAYIESSCDDIFLPLFPQRDFLYQKTDR